MACNTHEGKDESIEGSRENPEGRRPAGSPRYRWEDNIKMGLREIGWGRFD
jgi:hypothetical protein